MIYTYISAILEELLGKNVIELPTSKWLDEANKINDSELKMSIADAWTISKKEQLSISYRKSKTQSKKRIVTTLLKNSKQCWADFEENFR